MGALGWTNGRDVDSLGAEPRPARRGGALDGRRATLRRRRRRPSPARHLWAGPNALEKLSKGEARRVVKPNHVVNRAHVDDIAAVAALVLYKGLPGQIWNVADDEPSPPQDVIAYAAELMGVAPPPEEPIASAGLTPLTASFYAEEKRVSNAKAKALLGFRPAYPTYREGLSALWKAGEGR